MALDKPLDLELLDSVVAAAAALSEDLRGAVPAKRGTLQSYAQHSLAVAVAAARLADALEEAGVRVEPGQLPVEEAWLLAFLGGLVHDHNKAWGRSEREGLRRLVSSVLEERGYGLGGEELEELLEALYAVAEAAERGVTARVAAAGLDKLALIVALADLLASQRSLSRAEAALRSPEPRYGPAIGMVGAAGYEFKTIYAARPSLIVAEASLELLGLAAEKGCAPVLVYHDGVLLLCPKDAGIGYEEAAEPILRRLVGGEEASPERIEDARRRLNRLLRLGGHAYQLLSLRKGGLSKARSLALCCRNGNPPVCRGPNNEAVAEAAAHAAAAIASGAASVDDAVRVLEDVRKSCRVQVKNLLGGVKPAFELVKTLGASTIMGLAERLAGQGSLGELAALAAYLAAYPAKKGKGGRKRGSGIDVSDKVAEAARKEGLSLQGVPLGDAVVGVPVALGVALRFAEERGAGALARLVERLLEALGGTTAAALREFAVAYACSSLGGSLLVGKERLCRAAGEAKTYCMVCRTPLPDTSIGVDLGSYGTSLGLGRGVAELWVSDEAPLGSIELSAARRLYGEGARLVCPACIYEAKRLRQGIGVKEAGFPLLFIYALHPVASVEQLTAAALAVRTLGQVIGGVLGRHVEWRSLVESLSDALRSNVAKAGSAGALLGGLAGSVVVDYAAARVVVSFNAVVPPGLVEAEDRRSAVATLQHLAASLAVAAPLLALLGGQVVLSPSLASARPASKLVDAGRTILYVEEPLRRYGYIGGVAALLSFAARALPLAKGRDAPRNLSSLLIQLEHLAFEPPVAMLAPPRPGLGGDAPGGEAELLGLVLLAAARAGEGVEALNFAENLRMYSEAMCCLTRRRDEASRHMVQAPLREALSTVLDYMGALEREDTELLAVGRGVDALRRRGFTGPYVEAVRKALEELVKYFAEKARELSPSKARQLAEAILDTAYMLTMDCIFKRREEKEKICASLRGAAAMTSSGSPATLTFSS